MCEGYRAPQYTWKGSLSRKGKFLFQSPFPHSLFPILFVLVAAGTFFSSQGQGCPALRAKIQNCAPLLTINTCHIMGIPPAFFFFFFCFTVPGQLPPPALILPASTSLLGKNDITPLWDSDTSQEALGGSVFL